MLNSATTWHRKFWMAKATRFAFANDADDIKVTALEIPVFLEFLNE
jgi:hypothetical protein